MFRSGVIVVGLSLLCAVVSITIIQGQRTVVLVGVPVLASGTVMLAAAVYSVMVGICWASLSGLKGFAFAGQALLFGIIVISLVIMPIVITSAQLAEAAVFSGPTHFAIETYRVQSVWDHQAKGRMTYHAEINPYHCIDCKTPAVNVDQAAYETILASVIDAPANPDYPWDYRHKTTNLCMTFTVERAGAAERLRLAHGGIYARSDLKPCPPGAQ